MLDRPLQKLWILDTELWSFRITDPDHIERMSGILLIVRCDRPPESTAAVVFIEEKEQRHGRSGSSSTGFSGLGPVLVLDGSTLRGPSRFFSWGRRLESFAFQALLTLRAGWTHRRMGGSTCFRLPLLLLMKLSQGLRMKKTKSHSIS
jgi:hypothetical protein